ncbi:COPII subunit [Phlyctochytrium planicorne]|nr:COPII subunit [Phlyctochytrium planicorne]
MSGPPPSNPAGGYPPNRPPQPGFPYPGPGGNPGGDPNARPPQPNPNFRPPNPGMPPNAGPFRPSPGPGGPPGNFGGPLGGVRPGMGVHPGGPGGPNPGPGGRPSVGSQPPLGAPRPNGDIPPGGGPPLFGAGGPIKPSGPGIPGAQPPSFGRPPVSGPGALPSGPGPNFPGGGPPGPSGQPPSGFRPPAGPGGPIPGVQGGHIPSGPGGPGVPSPGAPADGPPLSPPAPSGAARARRAYAPTTDSYGASGDYGSTQPPAGMPPMMPPSSGPGGSFVPPTSVNNMPAGPGGPGFGGPGGPGGPGYGGLGGPAGPGGPGVIPPAGVPQFIQPAKPPSFGASPAAGSPGNLTPGMGGAPGMSPQPQGGLGGPNVNQLGGQLGQMNLGGGAAPQGPNNVPVVNVLQRPPEVFEFDAPDPTSWMSPQFSISQSPTSNCNPVYKRCTINSIPQTPTMLSKSRLPFGLLITPYRHLLPGEEPVPVINPPQIVRCRRCRTYINPWVQFVEQVPNFFDWDTETRSHVDRMKRAELTHAVVEYVAPQEYMVRPPQPVVMLFVIDVSFQSVQSGMLAVAAKSILASLDGIPNSDNRTKIGFITVDSTLHFYNLSSSLSEPQMLVVSDLEDVFLPLPYDLLVPLKESRAVIERLLTQLPDMFAQTQNTQNVLGRALQAGLKLISQIGGKIIVLQSVLPSISEGSLRAREDPKLLGTPKEVTLLQPAIAFYKNLAVDCSRSQVSIDVFLFNHQYIDVATLSGCAKFTGGSVFYYPQFNSNRQEDVTKFSKEMQHFLSRPIGLEAVLRVRASKGIKMTAFHGNFFLRSTDLLALPNVSPDNSYAIEMSIQDILTSNVACFQTALLHTSSNGERRIRVLTLAVPITTNLGDVFASADQYAIAALLAKKGIERSLISKIEDARDAITYKLNEIIAAYRTAFSSSGQSAQLILPKNLKLLPVLILGLLKSTAFRATNLIPSDLRSFAIAMMYVYPTELCLLAMHARFYALHLMEPTVGQLDENDKVIMPPLLNLSSEKLERNGLYLLDNSQEVFIWLGRAIAPELVQMIFDRPSYDAVPAGKVSLPTLKNEWSQRVQNVIGQIRNTRLLTMTTLPNIYVIKEDGDPNLRMWFLTHLIEDRMESGHSYPQFLQAKVIGDQ